MKTLTFLAITLLSGAIAGTLLGLINQVIVEPYIDKAIGIETQREINAGKIIDPSQQLQYRMWQKGGEVAASTIYGISLSALFGIVFVYSRNSLPGSNNKKKALVLTGIMFVVLFLIPTLKYPANPPAVGNPDTIYYRESLYVGFIAISGFSSLALALLYIKKLVKNINRPSKSKENIAIPVLLYVIIMGSAYLLLPPNPDRITIPIDLVTNFRIASAFTIGIFWGLMGIILGSFWDILKPHETSKIASI
ncbi:MAG: CbtA family protein [Thermoproteota archaeon]|nr:CbtA family protein [Thermoproteota archaeon]